MGSSARAWHPSAVTVNIYDPNGVLTATYSLSVPPHSTVFDNIRYARPEASESEIGTVARKIGDGEWIDGLRALCAAAWSGAQISADMAAAALTFAIGRLIGVALVG